MSALAARGGALGHSSWGSIKTDYALSSWRSGPAVQLKGLEAKPTSAATHPRAAVETHKEPPAPCRLYEVAWSAVHVATGSGRPGAAFDVAGANALRAGGGAFAVLREAVADPPAAVLRFTTVGAHVGSPGWQLPQRLAGRDAWDAGHGESVYGLLRTLGQEHPLLRCAALDLDAAAPLPPAGRMRIEALGAAAPGDAGADGYGLALRAGVAQTAALLRSRIRCAPGGSWNKTVLAAGCG
jgi:hypothetical protein